MILIAVRARQELYQLPDGSAVIVDHEKLEADFPPSVQAALKQGYWEAPSSDDGLILTEKHLAGKHNQQTHAGGRGSQRLVGEPARGGASVADLEGQLAAAKKAVSAKMKAAKQSGDYSGMSQLRGVVKGLEANLASAKKREARGGGAGEADDTTKEAVEAIKSGNTDAIAAATEKVTKKKKTVKAARDEIADGQLATAKDMGYNPDAYATDLAQWDMDLAQYQEVARALQHVKDNPDAYTVKEVKFATKALRYVNNAIDHRKQKGEVATSVEAPKVPKSRIGSADPNDIDSVRAEYSYVMTQYRMGTAKQREALEGKLAELETMMTSSPGALAARAKAKAAAGRMADVMEKVAYRKSVPDIEDAIARRTAAAQDTFSLENDLAKARIDMRIAMMTELNKMPGGIEIDIDLSEEPSLNTPMAAAGIQLASMLVKRKDMPGIRMRAAKATQLGTRAYATGDTLNMLPVDRKSVV